MRGGQEERSSAEGPSQVTKGLVSTGAVSVVSSAPSWQMAALLAKEEEQLKKTSNQDAQKVGSEQSMMKLLLSGKLRLIEKTNAEMKRMIEFQVSDGLVCGSQRPDPGSGHRHRVSCLPQNSLIELRAKLNSTEAEKVSVAEGLMAATEEVHQKTPLLRDQLTQTRAAARKQLTDLTVQSTATTKNLRAVIAKVRTAPHIGPLRCQTAADSSSLFVVVRARRFYRSQNCVTGWRSNRKPCR